MKQPNFTPGPWALRDNTNIVSTSAWLIEPNESEGEEGIPLRVVDLYGAMGGTDTNADARLIAAAPSMYEAIRVAALELSKMNTPGSPLGAIRDGLYAAFKLAEGEDA